MEESPALRASQARVPSVNAQFKPAERIEVPQWAHLLAGASGGLATAILTSPLDILRTRLQSDFYQTSPRSSLADKRTLLATSLRSVQDTSHIMRSIHHIEGWRGFFRGLGPSMAGVVPATAIKFYVYGNAKRVGATLLGRREDGAVVHALAAVAAGIATATGTNPIWLIKTRLQLDKSRVQGGGAPSRQYKNSLDCVRKVLRHEGISGLYRGLSASYLGTIETALHLVLYEQLKVQYRQALTKVDVQRGSAWNEISSWISTSGAAGTAKLAAVIITYPHEVMRTRLRQAPLENGVPKYTGLIQCFRSVGAQEGLAGLYGGLVPHTLRSIPSAIITLGVYEFVLRLIGA